MFRPSSPANRMLSRTGPTHQQIEDKSSDVPRNKYFVRLVICSLYFCYSLCDLISAKCFLFVILRLLKEVVCSS